MNFLDEDFWKSQDNFFAMNSIKSSWHEDVLNFCESNNLNGKIILKIIIYFHAFRLTPFKEELMMHLW